MAPGQGASVDARSANRFMLDAVYGNCRPSFYSRYVHLETHSANLLHALVLRGNACLPPLDTCKLRMALDVGE
jgi:hypothetical protein